MFYLLCNSYLQYLNEDIPSWYKKKEDYLNSINQKILDSVLNDDKEQFVALISNLISNDSDTNQLFHLTNYKLPSLLRNFPSYASLCAFFGAEQCFLALTMLSPGGIESEIMRKEDMYERSLMHFACYGGNMNIIRELVQSNYDLDSKDIEGCTPSCYAAMSGNIDVIRYLWTKGASILINDFSNTPKPFDVACLYGNLSIVKFIYETVCSTGDLEETKKNRMFLFRNSYFANTPFHLACVGGNGEILRYLLSLEEATVENVNQFNHKMKTPLMVSCQNGSLNCVKALIGSSKKYIINDRFGNSPLIYAAMCGHLDIVNYLLTIDGAMINHETTKQMNAITAAVLNKHHDIIQFLINNGALTFYNDNKLADLFLECCKTDDMKTIKILDSCCSIPYHQKCAFNSNLTWGDVYFQQACQLESDQLASFLLTKGCNFSKVKFDYNAGRDWNPLMDLLLQNGLQLSTCLIENRPFIVRTIESGNVKRVKMMISKGAVLNNEIIIRYKCVCYCCANGKIDMFKYLMKFKPTINDPVYCIKTLMSQYNHCASYNIKKGDTFYFMMDYIFKTQRNNIDEKDLFFQLVVACAAKWKLIEILRLFDKYQIDFTHCYLNYALMSTSDHLPVYKFLEKKGCQFDRSLQFTYLSIESCTIWNDSSISLLFNAKQQKIDEEVIIFLLKYSSKADIIGVINSVGNITDNLLAFKYYKALLVVFEKMEMLLFPLNTKIDAFCNEIDCCNINKLKEFVDMKIIPQLFA